MSKLLYEKETFKIIGSCFAVQNNLGAGFLEIVYKDALEIEFKKQEIIFEIEKEYSINYSGKVLPHKFYADFLVLNKIILEVKAVSALSDAHFAQSMNYLKVSGNRICLLVNFGQQRLEYQRIIK